MTKGPRKKVVIVLVEADRVRWQGAADLRGVALDRFVRDSVEAAIEEYDARIRRLPRWTAC